ncbi:cyanophycinase [Archangium minus]|uniref:Cyanophycinase n=1 Tax=Archangium minus TaxID=83450 RepID=A0ABY9X2U1_9BACT|nr:cyanophycinase [Archangium minus]
MKRQPGDLLIIGGSEDKESDEEQAILRQAAKKAISEDGGHIVLLTVATMEPEQTAETYRRAFGRLGVRRMEVLDIRNREQAYDPANVEKLSGASVLFFSGGDQLRITSQMGGSPLLERIFALHQEGVAIVGTSAGAAAMSGTMLIGGPGSATTNGSNPCLSSLAMAPGLGLLKGVIVDSHFSERGRFARLMGAVAQNPHNLGIGLDEDTAVLVRNNDEEFTVLGSGGVYVIDGLGIRFTSLSDMHTQGILTVHDARVHVLARNDRFSLKGRRPLPPLSPATP